MIFTAEVALVLWLWWQWKHRKTPWAERPPFPNPLRPAMAKAKALFKRKRRECEHPTGFVCSLCDPLDCYSRR